MIDQRKLAAVILAKNIDGAKVDKVIYDVPAGAFAPEHIKMTVGKRYKVLYDGAIITDDLDEYATSSGKQYSPEFIFSGANSIVSLPFYQAGAHGYFWDNGIVFIEGTTAGEYSLTAMNIDYKFYKIIELAEV